MEKKCMESDYGGNLRAVRSLDAATYVRVFVTGAKASNYSIGRCQRMVR